MESALFPFYSRRTPLSFEFIIEYPLAVDPMIYTVSVAFTFAQYTEYTTPSPRKVLVPFVTELCVENADTQNAIVRMTARILIVFFMVDSYIPLV
jgi:hypothetical protein